MRKRSQKNIDNLHLTDFESGLEGTGISVGQEYQHRNGINYRVIGCANAASINPKYLLMVVYANSENGNVFCKTLADFRAKLKQVKC